MVELIYLWGVSPSVAPIIIIKDTPVTMERKDAKPWTKISGNIDDLFHVVPGLKTGFHVSERYSYLYGVVW